MKKSNFILFVLVCSFFMVSCKKEAKQQNEQAGINDGENKVIVYVNGTDPRLAQIEKDKQIITFFGKRDSEGKPNKLTAYTIKSKDEPSKYDIVTIDDYDRFSDIILRTGEHMNLNYRQNDSILITIANPNNEVHQINAKFKTDIIKSSSNSVRTTSTLRNSGIDKNLNIEVVKWNTAFLPAVYPSSVEGNETTLIARFMAGAGYDVLLQVPYDNIRKLYSIPLSSAGFNFTNNPIQTTLDFIKNALNLLCAKTNSGNPNIDKSIMALITTYVCPLGLPQAKAICAAAGIVLFACKASSLLQTLNQLNAVIDPNSAPPSNAAVTVSSNHFKYGIKYSSTTVNQIVVISTRYDLQIIHEYKDTSTCLCTLKIDWIPYTWYANSLSPIPNSIYTWCNQTACPYSPNPYLCEVSFRLRKGERRSLYFDIKYFANCRQGPYVTGNIKDTTVGRDFICN